MNALVDAQGKAHRLAGPDARIACLVPSLTELLCDLDLAPQLVGRTGFCIHPRAAVQRIPKVGGTKAVDLEKLRSLRPTHVVVNMDENERHTVQALSEFVPHVIVTHPNAPEDNLAVYRLLGGVFGREAAAEGLCSRLRTRLDALRARTWPARRVLYLIWRDPWMTVARDTYIARCLAEVNWTTWPATQGGSTGAARYPRLSLQEPWLQTLDGILLSTEPYRFDAGHAEAMARATGKPAALIDGEMLSWYGSRAIAGLEYLMAFASEHLQP